MLKTFFKNFAKNPFKTPDKILYITFNFAFGSSINNMKFEYPQNPLYHDSHQWNMISCPDNIPEEGVKCNQVLTVELGDLVELRLVGAENPENEFRRFMWTYHTFHLHGYNFHVQSRGQEK